MSKSHAQGNRTRSCLLQGILPARKRRVFSHFFRKGWRESRKCGRAPPGNLRLGLPSLKVGCAGCRKRYKKNERLHAWQARWKRPCQYGGSSAWLPYPGQSFFQHLREQLRAADSALLGEGRHTLEQPLLDTHGNPFESVA